MALKKLSKREPALIAGALSAVLNALVLCDLLHLTSEQLGAVNIAATAVLSLFVRSRVTPNEPA
jgi:hypothetical protein